MSDIKSILKNMVLLGIVVFAVMSFIITVQLDGELGNGSRITNNSEINDAYGGLETALAQQGAAENSLNTLEDVPPTEYVGDLDVGSMVSATRTARAITIGLWNIYIKLPIVILGVSPIIAAAITTVLIIFLAIGIWAIWKGAIS